MDGGAGEASWPGKRHLGGLANGIGACEFAEGAGLLRDRPWSHGARAARRLGKKALFSGSVITIFPSKW